MDRSDLRGYVYSQTLIETTTANTTLIDTYLDQAFGDLSLIADWPWMIADSPASLVINVAGTGVQYVAEPTGFIKALGFYEAGKDQPLPEISIEEHVARTGGSTNEGTPTAYYLASSRIYVSPMSDAERTYNMPFLELKEFASGDTAEPPFLEAFHRCLAEFAMAKVWEFEEDFEKAEVNHSLFRDTAGRMHQHYFHRGTTHPLIFGQDKDAPARINPLRSNLPFGMDGLI